MTKKTWQRLGWMIVVLVFCGGTSLHAADGLPQKGQWEVGVRSGYSVSERKVDMVPAHLHIGYTVFKGQKWFIPPGALEIAAEPFGSVITRITEPGKRHGAMELGVLVPMFTYQFDLGYPIYPYIEGGLGMLYTDLRGYDLGGHFSFAETAGVGVMYFLDPHLALYIGGRFRHISNASLYEENRGLNSFMILGGFSYFLPTH